MEMTRDVSKDIGLLRGCDQGLGPRWCTIDTWDRILDPWLCMAWRRKQKLPRPGTLHWVFWNEPSEDGTKPYFVEVLQVSYLSFISAVVWQIWRFKWPPWMRHEYKDIPDAFVNSLSLASPRLPRIWLLWFDSHSSPGDSLKQCSYDELETGSLPRIRLLWFDSGSP